MTRLPLSIATAAVLLAGGMHGIAADEAKYRVGDHLREAPGRKDARSAYQEIGWNALIPEGWDPAAAFRNIDFSRLNDADPRASNALDALRKAWDEAPVERGWNGQRVRIPGFVVPLERRGEQVTEFLLVPYFGACIHVPPPPANQIIDVFPAKPVKNLRTMDAVWVIGVLDTSSPQPKTDSDHRMGMGTAGYRMKAERIEPYKEQR